MGILSWIILGLIAGAVAKKFVPGVAPSGCLPTLAVGVGGSAVVGLIASAAFHVKMNSFFSLTTWAVAIIGSIAALWLYQRFLVSRGNGPIEPDRDATRVHDHRR